MCVFVCVWVGEGNSSLHFQKCGEGDMSPYLLMAMQHCINIPSEELEFVIKNYASFCKYGSSSD